MQAQRNLHQPAAIGAAYEGARLLQARQFVGHGPETALEEIADCDVGPLQTGEHLLKSIFERRVGCDVEDVHSELGIARGGRFL